MFPVSSNEQARLAALRDLAIVGTGPEPHFDAVCRLAQSIFSVPIATISLIAEDRQVFKAKCGLDVDGTPRDVAFCNHTILSDEILVVEDAARDVRFHDNPLVLGEPHIRFYAGVPLSLRPGLRIGSLCVIDTIPRAFSRAQVQQLRDMAEVVTAHLRLHEVEQRQAAELEDRRRITAELKETNRVLDGRTAALDAANDARRVAETAASFGHWRIDAADLTVVWSDGIATVFKAPMPPDGVLPLDQHLAFYHPDERAALRTRIERVIAGIDPEIRDGYQGRARVLWRDGEVRHVIVRGVPQRGADGTVIAINGVILDVTEHARTHERLREVGELLGNTLDSMDQGLVVLDAEERIRAFNRAAAELLDLPGHILQEGASLADIRDYHAERGDFTEVPADLKRKLMVMGLQHLPAVYDLPLPNGTILEVRRSDRAAAGWIVTFADVTQQRLAENAVQESEHRYRLLAEHTTDIIIWCDLTTRRRYVSPAVTATLGYAPNDLIGTHPRDFVHPDEADAYRGILDDLVSGRIARALTCQRYRHRDGHYVWLEISLNLTRDMATGRADGYVATLRDITQRKAMEEALHASDARYRSLIEAQLQKAWDQAETTTATSAAILAQLAEGVIVTDAAGRITLVNGAAAEIHGVDRLDVEPDEYSDTYHLYTEDGRPFPPCELPLARAVKGETVRDARWRVQRPNGTEVLAIGNALPLLAQDGAQIGAVLTIRDDTARDAAENAVRDLNADLARRVTERTHEAETAREQAEAASRIKSEFLAAMSHEIRTPLNGVIGYADLLCDEPDLPPRARQHGERIRAAGTALLTVVNDVLDFSKLEAGQVEIVPRPFAPVGLIDNTVSIVRGVAEAKGLALVVNVDPAVPGWVLGDEDRLRQVLLNLLNNAVKFTARGQIDFRIEAINLEGAVHLRCSVRDTGIGIPADKRDRLFQRFSQVDGSIGRDFGGSGLGLAISKALIERMGGTIGVESEAGRGSVFWFELDLPVTMQPAIATEPSSPSARNTGKHLLLAEDVPLNQDLARAILERAGHRVDVVGDGTAAVAAVQASAYDLVLMDVQMPGLDGLSATRQIRRLDGAASRVPIMALTANVLPQQIAEFRAAGMDDHVGKPFRRDALLAVIDRWAIGDDEGGGTHTSIDLPVFEDLKQMVGHERMLDLMVMLADELAQRFSPCSNQRAREQVASDAHAMVSAASMVGFSSLANLCREVEAACRADDDFEPLLAKLCARSTETIAEIAALRAA